MKQIVIPAISEQYVRARVHAFNVSSDETDPTNATVSWAFTLDNNTVQPSDWQVGDWETGTDPKGTPQYFARFLITSGLLTAGTQYAAWLKIDGVTEVPVILLGNVSVV